MPSTKAHLIASWSGQLVAAVIMGQTLFFKFTGAEEPRFIFTTLLGRYEAYGRLGSGFIELIAVILLLIPKTSWLGAILTLGTMAGALFAHLTKLGIVVKDDGGTLFILGVVAFIAGAVVLFERRGDLPVIGKHIAPALSRQPVH
jgi:hypothetical protein